MKHLALCILLTTHVSSFTLRKSGIEQYIGVHIVDKEIVVTVEPLAVFPSEILESCLSLIIDECRSFFRDLCTPAELQAMADRWAVVELLERGLPYREIHKQTGVSVTTIGRVARCLADGNGGYQVAASRQQRHA